ncbi:MAG: ATP-binding protein [Actinomycetaceae bacterium]|nr:ATP-binding protein [Actinomycetaceae bacterium]MDU0971237.1 ATP-binding protein [Actinomycetaceae bacterium]
MANPFTPTMGATPRAFVGRDAFLADIGMALDQGPGSLEFVTLITGQRGTGKTAMLNAIQDLAAERSWYVISETATSGFMKRLTAAAWQIYGEIGGTQSRRQVTGATIGPVSISSSVSDVYTPAVQLRELLTKITDLQSRDDSRLHQDSVGILITLDELHHSNVDEVVEFATTIQHMVREGRLVAVAMAAIPSAVEPLLADAAGTNPITFLRRANRVILGKIEGADVRQGLVRPVESIGMTWSPHALETAVEATGGYPFMIQLVGYECVKRSHESIISFEVAQAAVEAAQQRLGQLVHEPALRDLSRLDQGFLIAMSEDDGPSEIGVIAQRLHVSPQQANTYKNRLLDAQMIEQVERGRYTISLPYMREYLRKYGERFGPEVAEGSD